MKIKVLKSELKQLAIIIRKDKHMFKECQRDNTKYGEYSTWRQSIGHRYTNLSELYRYRHVAYCLLRGRKYEEIENKVRNGNELNWNLVENIMTKYREVEAISCGETVV